MPVPDRAIQHNTVMPNPVVSPIPASNLSTIPKLPIRIATYRGEQAVNRDSHKVLEYFGSVQEESKPTPVLDMDLEEVTISIRQDTNTIYELVTLFKQTLSTEPVIFRTAGEIKDSYYSSENLNPHFASLRSCIDFKSVIRTLSNIPNQVYKLGNQLHYDAIGAVGAINNKLTDYFNNFVYYQLGADTVIESLITDYNSWLNNELANTDWLIQNNAIQHLREWERAFLSEYFNDSLDKESGVLQFRKKYIGISLPDLDETFLKVSNRDRMIISKETTPSLYTLLVSSFKESRIGDCDLVPHILMTRDDIAYVVNRDIENNFCIKELIPRFRNPAM
jgi:hypothetical protein